MADLIWRPSAARIEQAQLTAYTAWLARKHGLKFADYEALWRWSVTDLEAFWQSIWDYFEIASPTPHACVLERRIMPGARWFPGATLNYVAEVFRNGATSREAGRPAIVFRNEQGDAPDISWEELERRVASLAAALKGAGVVQGDRVVAYLPNIPETIIAFFAVASLGAIWSVCSPDMGPVGVLDRFRQIGPKILIACDGYRYGGKDYDRRDTVTHLLEQLPTVETLIHVPLVYSSAAPFTPSPLKGEGWDGGEKVMNHSTTPSPSRGEGQDGGEYFARPSHPHPRIKSGAGSNPTAAPASVLALSGGRHAVRNPASPPSRGREQTGGSAMNAHPAKGGENVAHHSTEKTPPLCILQWRDCIAAAVPLQCVMLPFDHPLWIVYSSGTTGIPKPIVHGHGGVVLVALKEHRLQNDVGAEDRFHWFASTGWIMWNSQVGALLGGSTACLYDGNPGWPDWNTLWKFAGERRIDFFGAGAAFYASCMKAGIEPREVADLSALHTIGSTGSPLSSDSYRWIYEHVKDDIWLVPISGGTDMAATFVCGVVTQPVIVGEMQCRSLGAAVYAYDDAGRPVEDTVGELVCTEPLPSMPLYFWNDANNKRYLESYFDMYPGVWRHGDWIRIVPRPGAAGAIIYGRSDATINRHGIRMGTSELYRAVEALPEVIDSLVVDLEYLGRESWMPLFVVLRDGHALDEALVERIKTEIKKALSPRHVPNDIFAIASVPRTLSGKKLELPVKKLLMGEPIEKVVNRDAMANPESMDWFVALAARRRASQSGEA